MKDAYYTTNNKRQYKKNYNNQLNTYNSNYKPNNYNSSNYNKNNNFNKPNYSNKANNFNKLNNYNKSNNFNKPNNFNNNSNNNSNSYSNNSKNKNKKNSNNWKKSNNWRNKSDKSNFNTTIEPINFAIYPKIFNKVNNFIRNKDNKKASWLYDTGSTEHISNNKDNFISLEYKDNLQLIRTGKGIIQPTGIGKVQLSIIDNIINLIDVLYIPEFPTNIISGIKHYNYGGKLNGNKLLDKNNNVITEFDFNNTGFFF